jgi:UDP-N-acetyl-2-amino-2-deoxyglucuronate dehydrogenase
VSDVGLALVGATGMWGPKIADAVERAPGVRLVTCFARDAAKLAEFARSRGLAAAPAFEAAVEHFEVEGVLLVTPNDIHAEQALACAERGKHVFVEKPIADTLEAGERMRDAFASAALVLAVGHGMRRLGASRRIKEVVDEGALGTIVLAEANWSLTSRVTPAAWRWHRERNRGGPLMQLGVHHADTLAYWLGPIGRSDGLFAHVSSEAEADDVGVVLVEFASGALGSIVGSYVSPQTYFVRLLGTEAVLEYEADMAVWPRADRVDEATRLVLRSRSGAKEIEFERRDPLAEELEEFGRAIRGGTEPETGPGEALAALGVIVRALDGEPR